MRPFGNNLINRGFAFLKRKTKLILFGERINDNERAKNNAQYKWVSDLGITKVFDIGANEGQFALKIRQILPHAKVISFEPLDAPYEILCNRFSSDSLFKAYKVALSTKKGKETIYLNEYSPSSSLLKMGKTHKDNFPFARVETAVEIDTDVLDNYEFEIDGGDIVLMKIDVQGYEKFVLNGGKNVLSKIKVLLIEVSFKQLYDGQVLYDEMYRILTSAGFEYRGNWEQLRSPVNGEILQADSIFVKTS